MGCSLDPLPFGNLVLNVHFRLLESIQKFVDSTLPITFLSATNFSLLSCAFKVIYKNLCLPTFLLRHSEDVFDAKSTVSAILVRTGYDRSNWKWLDLLTTIVTKEFEFIPKMLCQPHPYNKYSGCEKGQPCRQKMHCLHQQEERDLKYIPCTRLPPTEGIKNPATANTALTASIWVQILNHPNDLFSLQQSFWSKICGEGFLLKEYMGLCQIHQPRDW